MKEKTGEHIKHPPNQQASFASISAISGTISLSFQSSFHLSFTVLVLYRSPTSI